jgi:hypothetical protein
MVCTACVQPISGQDHDIICIVSLTSSRWPSGFEEALLQVGYLGQDQWGKFGGASVEFDLRALGLQDAYNLVLESEDELCKTDCNLPEELINYLKGDIISYAKSSPTLLSTKPNTSTLVASHVYTVYRGLMKDGKRL